MIWSYFDGKLLKRGEAGSDERWFCVECLGIVPTNFKCRGKNFNLSSSCNVNFLTDKTLFLLINEFIWSLWEFLLCFAGMIGKHQE